MRKITCLFLLSLLFIHTQALSQYTVVLENFSKLNRKELKPGTALSFRVEGQQEWHDGVLWGAGPELLNISGDSIPPDMITSLRLPLSGPGKQWMEMIIKNCKKGAIVFATMNAVNRPWDSWSLRKAGEVTGTVAGLWLIGELLEQFREKRRNLRKKWRLYIREPFRWAPGQQGESAKDQLSDGQLPWKSR